MAQVTADDIRELLTSGSMDPILVRWLDTDEIEVISGVLTTDISYSNYRRAHQVLASANDLRQMGDWDINNPTDEDFEAFAQQLNEG